MKKERYQNIAVDDGKVFEHNFEVMNKCFNDILTSDLRKATWPTKDGCIAWFPFKAKTENGRLEPGSSNVNWKNIIEDNGNTVIQMLYPNEKKTNEGSEEPVVGTDTTPHHTFMKFGDHEYRYIGTFVKDIKASAPRYQIFRRVKDHIDLSTWYSGHDLSYTDPKEQGIAALKDFYYGKNYKEHKKKVDEFEALYGQTKTSSMIWREKKSEIEERFKIARLRNMTDDYFKNVFITELAEALSRLYGKEISTDDLLAGVTNANEWGRNLLNFLSVENSCSDRIMNSKWSREIASKLLAFYDEDEYLYTLPDYKTDLYLDMLKMDYGKNEDIVIKQNKLYFWKGCNQLLMGDWPATKFCDFLEFLQSGKKTNIKYIQSPKPVAEKRVIEEEKKIEEDFLESEYETVPETFEYSSKPRIREINTSTKDKTQQVIPRHNDRKINALVRAGHACEIDAMHPSFKRRNSDYNYVETHHLIPIEFSDQFANTLDTEENIVALCSNCHNQIHYGKGAALLLKKLYDERIEHLKAAGISQTIDGIEVTFEQLLHMYKLDR